LLLSLGRTDLGLGAPIEILARVAATKRSPPDGEFAEEPIYIILLDFYELKEGRLPPLVTFVVVGQPRSLAEFVFSPRGCQSSDTFLAKESSPPNLKTRNLPLEI
jgi:hypothetical protein